MIGFACASCQMKLSVKEELAGKRIKCPGCGQSMLVPGPVEKPAAAVEDLPTIAPVAPPTGNPPTVQPTPPPPDLSDATHDPLPPEAEDTAGLIGFLAPAQSAKELGRLGGFRILKILGHGGMGVVSQGEDLKLGRKVAIKAMLPHLAGSMAALQRFLREARMAAALEHDHIVPILQVGEDRGAPFIVMPLLKGEPLDERLKRDKKLAVSEVLRIGREIARGLGAAHVAGLIHRDIKPANIWLEISEEAGAAPSGGRVKILDFGLARASAQDKGLTQAGAIVGTPTYMAPEQASGTPIDARCDLWSLGVVLYRACTGQLPFQGSDTLSTLMAVASEEPAAPAALNPDVPAGLSELVMKLLAKDPAGRPASAQEVVQALRALEHQQQATQELPSPQSPLAPTKRAGSVGVGTQAGSASDRTKAGSAGGSPPARKNRRPLLLGMAGALVAILAVVLLWLCRTPPGPVSLDSADPGKTAQKPAVLPPLYTNKLGMAFALVPRGKSWLGGGAGKIGIKEVEIRQDFYLGVYAVTQEEWEKVMKSNPSNFKAVAGVTKEEQKRFPVEMISWEDAQQFVKAVTEQYREAGWEYCLPTEEEWEYACRGGPMTDKADSAFDFYLDKPTNVLSADKANFAETGLNRPCPVGSYAPNRLGLYDMHGNVWQWCADEVKAAAGASQRVRRGGSWHLPSGGCRAAYRIVDTPSFRNNILGLRLVRVPSAK